MDEKRELIAANALPVTEAEEVDVLVVDPATGELCKKSGANLGGGKNAIYTVIFIYDYDNYTSELVQGDYDEAVSVITNNGLVDFVCYGRLASNYFNIDHTINYEYSEANDRIDFYVENSGTTTHYDWRGDDKQFYLHD